MVFLHNNTERRLTERGKTSFPCDFEGSGELGSTFLWLSGWCDGFVGGSRASSLSRRRSLHLKEALGGAGVLEGEKKSSLMYMLPPNSGCLCILQPQFCFSFCSYFQTNL